MKYDLIETGKRIAAIREEHNLTQGQLAEKLNVSRVHIGKIESGKHGASIDLLADFSCQFAVSLDYLILGKKEYDAVMSKDAIRNAIDVLKKIETQL